MMVRPRGRPRKRETFFPEQLWIEILARLPVKSLLRFRKVNKTWCSWIDSKRFRKQHFLCYNSVDRLKVAPLVVVENEVSSDFENVAIHCAFRNSKSFSLVKYSRFGLGFNPNHHYGVVGYANGVMCIRFYGCNDLEMFKIAVLNPSLRKQKYIPLPPVASVQVEKNPRTGELVPLVYVDLAFGCHGDHFKILAMGYPYRSAPQPEVLEVFAKSGESEPYAWRGIEAKGSENSPCAWCTIPTKKVFLNEAVHFMGYNKRNGGGQKFTHFVVFDMAIEDFSYMELPSYDETDAIFLDRSPAIIRGEILGLVQTGRSRATIWKMEEYGNSDSWVKLYEIADASMADTGVEYLKRDFEMFYFDSKGCQLMGYNLTNGIERFIMRTHRKLPMYVDTLVESFMMLNLFPENDRGRTFEIGESSAPQQQQ